MQSWDAWGGAWGYAWGGAWGFKEESGGGGVAKRGKKTRGWVNERAAFDASVQNFRTGIKETQASLRQTKDAQAIRIANKINTYDVGRIDLDALRIENEALKSRLKINEEYSQSLQEAQEIMDAFIEDEQDAIDLLFADFEIDVSIVLRQH